MIKLLLRSILVFEDFVKWLSRKINYLRKNCCYYIKEFNNRCLTVVLSYLILWNIKDCIYFILLYQTEEK